MTLSDMEKLTQYARQQLDAEVAVKKAEFAVKERKKELARINEELLPELMDELGIETYTTTEGIELTVKTDIRASISKDNRAEAYAWLRAHGHKRLIKRTVTVVAADDEQGDAIIEALGDFEYSDKPNIHAQTLGAWAREKLSAGADIPMELLGVFRQRVSKVKVKK